MSDRIAAMFERTRAEARPALIPFVPGGWPEPDATLAIACSADMMGDLKTGYLIGASPFRQQVWQVYTAAIGPIITMLTLVLIMQVNLQRTGKPIGEGTQTTAPQAQALEAIITGVQGGDMPYMLYGLGAVTGVLPVTGIPLPFVSFGGSALIVTMFAAGVLTNVARQGARAGT